MVHKINSNLSQILFLAIFSLSICYLCKVQCINQGSFAIRFLHILFYKVIYPPAKTTHDYLDPMKRQSNLERNKLGLLLVLSYSLASKTESVHICTQMHAHVSYKQELQSTKWCQHFHPSFLWGLIFAIAASICVFVFTTCSFQAHACTYLTTTTCSIWSFNAHAFTATDHT